MNVTEFINDINNVSLDSEIDAKIKSVYGASVPDYVLQILSARPQGEFFDSDDVCRIMSVDEILNASKELEVDFVAAEKIPVFDVGDNCFVCYDLKANVWLKYNIVDMTSYGRKATLNEMFH